MMEKFTNSSKAQNNGRPQWLYSIVLMCLMIMFGATNAYAQPPYSGGGFGTESSPYLLSTKADLTNFFNDVFVSGIYEENNSKKYFRMTKDINMENSIIYYLSNGNDPKMMANIVFDGGGYTISNVRNSYTYKEYHYYRGGLFPSIDDSWIKNLTVSNFEFHGNIGLGGLVGIVLTTQESSIIENCHVKNGTLYGHSYSSEYDDTLGAQDIGGLVGYVASLPQSPVAQFEGCSVSNDVKIIFCEKNNNTAQTTHGKNAGGLIGHCFLANITINDCLIGTDLKSNVGAGHTSIGGLIGLNSQCTIHIARVVLPIDNVTPHETNWRGRIIGANAGTVTTSMIYVSNTNMPVGAGDPLSSYPRTYSTLNNAGEVYTNLERTDLYGGVIAAAADGNKCWGYGSVANLVTDGPILTKQNYLVKLTKETSVYTITGNGVKYYSNNNYYSLANYPVIVTANAWPSDNRQLNFYINDEIVYTIQGNSSPRTYDGHTPIKDGIFKTTSVYIPYPESGLSGTFDQWNNIITLKWTSNNGDKIQGKWYIYKRLNNTTGAWSRTEGPDAVLSFHNYQHPVSTTSTDWDKTWDYAISFFPDGEDILNVPHPYNSKTITVAATTNISITNFKAVGQTNKIVISANVPTQLTNSTLYKYSIYRKADEGSFNAIQTDRRFDGTGKIEYIDEGISSPCITYTYYIEITAFNRNFKSNNVSASSTGSTVLTSLTATKGEYTDHVRLEWTTNKTTTQNSDRYKIFRAVVTNANPNPTWTELATINTNDISYVYTDDRAMPGIYYRYKVAIYQVCSDEIIEMNQLSDLGFAQSLGDVSGRVTYGSGISVKDVSISAIRNDLQQNESQYHSLKCTTATNGKYFYWTPTASYYNDIINGNFTYQFWLNPNANMTGETKIAEIGNLLNIFLVRSGGRYLIHLKTTSGTTVLTTTDGILPSRFTHVSIVRNGNNFTCYIANDENLDNIQLKTSSSSYTFGTITATTNMGIRMGYSFVGYIDECRFWSRALSANEIRKDFNRILVGNEDNLRAYWTFDEGIDSYYTEAGYFFDISCVGTMFNRNHGRHNLICDTTIPTADQLGLKAFTDSNGNYQIRGIPFSGSSSSYDIVPTLGVHTFNPSSHLRIIGNNSLVHNGVDFTDISSFNVSGTVVYKDGDYPVTGCNFEVDGAIQTNSDGSAVTNNDDGSFSISVPIGEHTVRVVKTGHVFENNGYLTMPEGGYNKHESGKMFYDKTRVKLIGRVVGGLTEHNKPLAFGESVNNTGASTVKLTATLSNYNLQNNSHSETFKHNEGQWQKPNSRPDDSTLVTYNKKDITITISPETGEFVAWVYPEVYTIGKITAQNYNEDIYNKNEILDLSQAAVPNDDMLKTSIRTWQDSVLVQRPGQIDYYEHFENSDTVRYHADWAIYYQAVPTFNVSQLSGQTPVPYFGETEYHLEDALTGESEDIVLWDENTGYLFDAPVFIQGNRYTFGFEAREQYINHVNNGTIYMYPINEGTVTLTNTVALNSSSNIELDETGKATHTFMAGAPDLTTGKHSFLGTIKIGAAEYYWDYGITAMEVWHLGDKTTGTDFMTAGPNEITTILRDPPGSLSYSYIETGTTITTNSSSEVKNGMQEVMNLTTTLGPLVKTFIGLGGGVILESEVTFDTSLGIHTEQTWISSTETSNSVTFVESFETSDDPLYVGHLGDIFIGNSTNIQYGLTNGVSIYRDYVGNKPALINKDTYSIAPSVSLAYGQTFDTRFVYTQIDLEEIMIPKWRENLAHLLQPMGTQINTSTITRPIYVSNLPADDVNFGKLNTDVDAFGDEAVGAMDIHDGPSYTVYFPDDYVKENFNIDSVMWFNNQINGWINVLAQNEKEKVEMTKLGNYSFGSGSTTGWSTTQTSSKTTTSTFHWIINPTIGLTTGASVMGIGMELESKLEYIHEEEGSSSEQTETSITSGFVLKEEGDDDQITVDYGVTESGTLAFRTLAGRTSCPYEDAYITKYYEPGLHVLSEATMQIEVPVIDINGSNQIINVPSNKTAIFVLDLKNESETNEDVWFQLIVDEQTNPHGAELKIDGGSIGNGRTFLVKAGEVLKKTLSVGKGTVDDYDNIGLILRSTCQSDPTDFLPVIADTAYISVNFIPGCSDVNISEPYNNWIVNTETNDTLQIVLNGFQRDYENFGYIQLEYRNVSSPTWSTLMNFYANEDIFNNASGYKALISSTDQNIVYNWAMRNVPDASYELRATAVCVNINASGVILDILSQSPSQIVTGRKDLTRPEALGAPSPLNGILSIGDEISITFNEEIQTGMLTKNNFSISGVLNASEIAEPNTGLYFTGIGSAYTELPISVNGSFSIETWFKRTNGTAGTLFSYGEGNNFISLSLDAIGRAVVQIGDEIQTSVSAMSNTTNTWKYIGLAYNRTEKTVYVYGFQDSDPTIELFVSRPFTNVPPTLGKLYVGNTNDNSNGFKGAMGMLHFYNVAHTSAEMSLVKGLTKSGTEPNLIGLWEMTEAEGSIAKDKARSRNLVVNSDWYIYPAGKSLLLNGTTQYATIPSEEFGFRYFDDFTIEMQFKGVAQGEATLLSAGMSAYIEFNADNKLVLSTGTNTQVLTNNNLLDGNWHHIALSVKRGGMTTAIIDGVATSTFSSTIFSDIVGGGYYYLGVNFYANTSTGFFEYTKYFNGNIDEIRVWNTALSTSIINQNRKYKLVGDEVGLVAYYPFEAWETLPDGTTLVSEFNKDFVDNTRMLEGTYVMDNIAAAIIDSPAVTILGNELISYVASSNKIVLTLEEEFYRLEGVNLEISVENVLDLCGNVSKPAKWTAFVNQNPLEWITDPIDIVMEYDEVRTFTASIQNRAGVSTNYFINNLPSWLTVNSSSGILLPLATKELTFTINENTNIGSYEASIVLEGVNNVQKPLPLTLKVTGERPDWEVNLSEFEQTMTVTGIVHVENIPQEDEDDILAAFINKTCVGVASPVFESSFNAYYIYMMIGGNSEHNGQEITFKLWDASTGNIYPVIDLKLNNSPLTITFLGDDIQGSPDNPIHFNALDIIEQSINMSNGWTWISVNVTSANPTLINQFKSETVEYATQLKAGNGNVLNNVSGAWYGTVSELINDQMYIVNTTSAAELTMIGKPANPLEIAITLEANKCNWIGYTPQISLSVSEALAGITNPIINDQVKGQKGYRMMSTNGWVGSLNAMEPGHGYKYKSNNTQNTSFYYPNASLAKNIEIFEDYYEQYWNVDHNLYANNMTITASLFIDNIEIQDGIYEIAAFVGDECRGSAIMQYIDGFAHPYMGFLMIYGNSEEVMHFKAYNHFTGETYDLNESIIFAVDAIFGTPDELYPLTAFSPTGVENYNGKMMVYPNPVESTLFIQTSETPESIKVYDITGKLLLNKEEHNETSINVSTLKQGVYFIHVEINGQIFVEKFIKQ